MELLNDMGHWDLACPYCGAGNDVCSDDGDGCEEDVYHEMECQACKKNFTFKTTITYSYEPYKSDCLNGDNHELYLLRRFGYPHIKYFDRCKNCSYESLLREKP